MIGPTSCRAIFNQAGSYLEECVYWAAKYDEQENNLTPGTVSWTIPDPECEIRTVLFKWRIDGEKYRMFYREQRTFRDLSVEDFGLRPTDTDTHVPQFLILTKSKQTAVEGAAFREMFRTRSEAGKQKDKDRKNKNKWAKRQAIKEATAALTAPQKAASTAPAASSWEPMPKTPEPKATTSKRGAGTFRSWHF